jgi:beta-galactosidase
VSFGDLRIVYATAEIRQIAPGALTFRLTQAEDLIALETEREVLPSAAYDVERSGAYTLVRSRQHALVDDRLTVRWR